MKSTGNKRNFIFSELYTGVLLEDEFWQGAHGSFPCSTESGRESL
jgi:hypothetical protein